MWGCTSASSSLGTGARLIVAHSFSYSTYSYIDDCSRRGTVHRMDPPAGHRGRSQSEIARQPGRRTASRPPRARTGGTAPLAPAAAAQLPACWRGPARAASPGSGPSPSAGGTPAGPARPRGRRHGSPPRLPARRPPSRACGGAGPRGGGGGAGPAMAAAAGRGAQRGSGTGAAPQNPGGVPGCPHSVQSCQQNPRHASEWDGSALIVRQAYVDLISLSRCAPAAEQPRINGMAL